MNNSEALTTLIVGGRTAKEYSQRELARRVGISNSSLNDIENGRVAKPDPEILKRIAEEPFLKRVKIFINSIFKKEK